MSSGGGAGIGVESADLDKQPSDDERTDAAVEAVSRYELDA